MNKLILALTGTLCSTLVFAQKTPAKPKPAAKPATQTAAKKPVLKNLSDSASYAIGMGMGNFYVREGFTSINPALVQQGMTEVLKGKAATFDDAAANEIVNNMFKKLQAEKSKALIAAGEKFLAENKKKPGVTTTATGLQYEVITQGTGIKPTIEDTFVVHYRGTLLDGTEFDASYNRGTPLVMPVNQVIAGWIEGLQLMNVGSKYKLYIPYQLGYGLFGSGPVIPGGSMLIFEMELLDVKKKQ